MSISARPANYKRRAESEWRDLPMEVRLGIVDTELNWAKQEGDAEQIRVLSAEAEVLCDAIKRSTPRPPKAGEMALNF
jgi:hypothetical protein